jgi:DNA-binding MarR family transcriptional regulator
MERRVAMNAFAADIPYRAMLAPAVLLFGDDAGCRADLADMVARGGGRVAAQGYLGDAADRIAMQVSAASVILDIRRDGGAALDGLLARIERVGATAGRPAVLVIVPLALIDVVAAWAMGPGVAMLVDPQQADLDSAIAQLLEPPSALVAESGEASGRRLAELSEEVGRIARALADLSGEAMPRATPPPTVRAGDGPLLRALIRLRRMRGQHFQAALFADPAWDILLDLAVARIEGRMEAVSSLCIAAAVPATTALRWIAHMTDHGLLVRQPDPTDGRRVFIALGDAAAAGMDAYLAGVRKVMVPVG